MFCKLPFPDGLKVDTSGNVWSTAGDGVRVMSPGSSNTGAMTENPTGIHSAA